MPRCGHPQGAPLRQDVGAGLVPALGGEATEIGPATDCERSGRAGDGIQGFSAWLQEKGPRRREILRRKLKDLRRKIKVCAASWNSPPRPKNLCRVSRICTATDHENAARENSPPRPENLRRKMRRLRRDLKFSTAREESAPRLEILHRDWPRSRRKREFCTAREESAPRQKNLRRKTRFYTATAATSPQQKTLHREIRIYAAT